MATNDSEHDCPAIKDVQGTSGKRERRLRITL